LRSSTLVWTTTPSTRAEDYLNVLSDLVKRFEINEHPLPPVPDAELPQAE
jgi:hypothetical protein